MNNLSKILSLEDEVSFIKELKDFVEEKIKARGKNSNLPFKYPVGYTEDGDVDVEDTLAYVIYSDFPNREYWMKRIYDSN